MATIDIFQNEPNSQSFVAGDLIFREGDPGDVMYVVQEGEVDLFYREQRLETVGPGGVFGEMVLIDAVTRSATAIARTNCRVVPLNQTRFKVHVHHTPYFALQVMQVMADRLRRLNDILGE